MLHIKGMYTETTERYSIDLPPPHLPGLPFQACLPISLFSQLFVVIVIR
jgi:hypothetical protein